MVKGGFSLSLLSCSSPMVKADDSGLKGPKPRLYFLPDNFFLHFPDCSVLCLINAIPKYKNAKQKIKKQRPNSQTILHKLKKDFVTFKAL